MNKKFVILMAGGSAAGKSTTTQALAQGEPNEVCEMLEIQSKYGPVIEKVYWTVYDNCALAGRHKNGSDANKGPAGHRAAFTQCLPLSDIVIVDGKINSPQWVEMVNEASADYDICLFVLYFKLSAEELLTRLAKRRGVDKESIRESMYAKCERATRVAELLVINVEKLSILDWLQLDVDATMSPDDIAAIINNTAEHWFNGGA